MSKPQLEHSLALPRTMDEAARQDFVSSLRAFILHDLADEMRSTYENNVKSQGGRIAESLQQTTSDVHRAMRDSDSFRFYSCMRVNAQEMVWDAVRDQVHRERARIREKIGSGASETGQRGSLHLRSDFEVPKYVAALDVHRMPGNYHTEFEEDDATQGALFDNGSAVFYMGLLGRDQGDIGRTMARFIRGRFPDFEPRRILDVGCLVGQNTLPWAQEFPQAEVHAIDVAAPCLRYAHARASGFGTAVHFHQMDATSLEFPDDSFDLVWSSMFFHEVPLKHIVPILRECHRVLRPGGLMVHMELPPNKALSAYDGFYLDWDSWYNVEPFYKAFRDQDPRELCKQAGFSSDCVHEFVVPSLNAHGTDAVSQAAESNRAVGSDTGRLAQGLSWYAFGAQK